MFLRLILQVGCLVFGSVEAVAHGGVVESIDLSSSPELKQAVIRAAQRFLGTTRLPEAFDLVNGKVSATFERSAGVAVLVDVLEYGRSGEVRIFGFKDARRLPKEAVPKDAAGRISPTKAVRAAQKILEHHVPPEMQAELSPLGLRLLSGVYVAKWIRKVRGVPVLGNETFEVGVNGVTGEVVYWELGIFDFPALAMDLRVSVEPNEARRRATDAVRERGLQHALLPRLPVMMVVHGREPYYGMVFASGDAIDRLYVTVHGRRGQVQIGPPHEEFEEIVGVLRSGGAGTFPRFSE